MLINNIDNFHNGWIVGDFQPTLYPATQNDIGVLYLKAGEKSDGHYHAQHTEYNLIISGSVRIGGETFTAGEIFIFEPYETSEIEFVEDTTLLVLKNPSTKNDKHYPLSPNSLGQLALRYGTDKAPNFHDFTSIYERYFSPINDSVLNVLEVGMGAVTDKGYPAASLMMWRDFFPRAQIYGIDINDYTHLHFDRISIFQADQGNKQELEDILKVIDVEFDIIVEDGSHIQHHQQQNLAWLLPYVKSGGYYVVEDLYFSYYQAELEAKRIDSLDTPTLDMLKHFVETGKIKTSLLTDDEKRTIEENVESCVIEYGKSTHDSNGVAEIAVIRKK